MFRSGRHTALLLMMVVLASLGPTTSARTSALAPGPPTTGPVTVLATEGVSPDVAVDPAGNTTVVWSADGWAGAVRAVRRPAGGSWEQPVTIGHGSGPQVATDARGDVTVIWSTNEADRTTGVMAARRPAGGSWLPAERLSQDVPVEYNEGIYGAQSRSLAASPTGAVLVVWAWGSGELHHPYRVQAVYRPADRAWLPLVNLTRPDWSRYPAAAVDRRGNAVVVFGSNDGPLQARRRIVGHGWTAPATLARSADSWSVVVDHLSNITAAFTQAVRTSTAVRAIRRPAGGRWTTPRTIPPVGAALSAANLVVDRAGTVTLSYQRSSRWIDAVRRPLKGPWGSPVRIRPAGRVVYGSIAVVNTAGDLLVSWDFWPHRVQGVFRPRSGRWTVPFDVVPAADGVLSYRTAVDPHGDAVVVWQDGSNAIKVRALHAQ